VRRPWFLLGRASTLSATHLLIDLSWLRHFVSTAKLSLSRRCRSEQGPELFFRTWVADKVGAPGLRPPLAHRRLGRLNLLGQILLGGSPVLDIIALGRWLSRRLQQDACLRSLCRAPPASAGGSRVVASQYGSPEWWQVNRSVWIV